MQYELNSLGFNRRLVSNVVQHSKWWLSSPSPLNFSSVEIGVGASWWRSSKRAGSLVTGRRIWGGDVFFSRLDGDVASGENLELRFCSLWSLSDQRLQKYFLKLKWGQRVAEIWASIPFNEKSFNYEVTIGQSFEVSEWLCFLDPIRGLWIVLVLTGETTGAAWWW